jgi:hypothetical protein
LERYKRDGVGRIDQHLRTVLASGAGDVRQGSGLAILRSGQAEGDEACAGTDRLRQFIERHPAQAKLPLVFGDEQRVEDRGELVIGDDDLEPFGQADRDQPDANGGAGDERDFVRVAADEGGEEMTANVALAILLPDPVGLPH